MLETFVPGYKGVFAILDQVLGIDISLVISGCVLLFGLLKFWSFVQEQIYALAKGTVLSEIAFDSDDEIYIWIMEWIKKQPLTGRKLIAKVGMSSENSWKSHSKKGTLREPPEISYEPSMGTHYLWFQRRLFRFSQWVPRERGETVVLRPRRKHVEATLSCVGRTAMPIQKLLLQAAADHFEKMSSMTPIYRPHPKTVRENARGYWSEIASRPSRSMDTVIFDAKQKATLVKDMDEYLQPETMKWYADHGIPYRRGYLFFGPPGTGKSSLCFALAGHFRLPLYCLSLQEPSMTEEDLAALFDSLPRQCIAVLEDVDCAGLVVRTSSENSKEKNGSISLSALLNIIDGVASQEGRVLIMTTNRVEVLDTALVRPGRVDLRIEFELASKDDARRLFDGIYDEKNSVLGEEFAKNIPDNVVSAAEIQGFLLVRKGNPKLAIKEAAAWLEDIFVAREEKKQKEKEEAVAKDQAAENGDHSHSEVEPHDKDKDTKPEPEHTGNDTEETQKDSGRPRRRGR